MIGLLFFGLRSCLLGGGGGRWGGGGGGGEGEWKFSASHQRLIKTK